MWWDTDVIGLGPSRCQTLVAGSLSRNSAANKTGQCSALERVLCNEQPMHALATGNSGVD